MTTRRVMLKSDLPRWKCHKVVEAAEIVAFWPTSIRDIGQHQIHVQLPDGTRKQLNLPDAWASRVPPNASPIGGYYVRYEDGFESWSPADAFEAGYTRMPEGRYGNHLLQEDARASA